MNLTHQRNSATNSSLLRRRSRPSSPKCVHLRKTSDSRGHSSLSRRSAKDPYASTSNQQEDISIPGVNKIFAKDYTAFGKVFWILAITACFLSCSVLTITRIVRYADTPIAIRVEVARESQLTFPAITICPFYPFFYSEEIDGLRDDYSTTFKVNYTKLGYFNDNTTIPHLDLIRLPNVSAAELWNKAQVGTYDYIITCQFESRRNCDRKVLFKNVYTHFGICLTATFDSDIIYDGSYNGVEIKLLNHSNREIAYWQHTVLLHDAEDEPTHILYREGGQPIHPRRETTVTFLTKQFQRVNIRKRPCQSRQEVTQCISDCIIKNIAKTVDCTLPFFTNSSLSECKTPEEAIKTYGSTLKIYKNIEKLCSHCPVKCTEYYYSPLYDSVYFRNFTSAKFILVDNSMDLVQEFASYSFDSLLADVGGNLGLFLGVCTLTFFQLLEALVMKLKPSMTKFLGSRRTPKSECSKSDRVHTPKVVFSTSGVDKLNR